MGTHSPTSSRKIAAEQTRELLLDAGAALAETTGLEGLSVNALVAAAGVSKGSFFHHFGDRTAYLVALHRRFHDALTVEILGVVAGLEPGNDRLHGIATTYLDACLRDRGVKALIFEARSTKAIQDEVLRRNAATVDLISGDFRALAWKHPASAARLWIAAVAEAALVELETGRRNRAVRESVAALT